MAAEAAQQQAEGNRIVNVAEGDLDNMAVEAIRAAGFDGQIEESSGSRLIKVPSGGLKLATMLPYDKTGWRIQEFIQQEDGTWVHKESILVGDSVGPETEEVVSSLPQVLVRRNIPYVLSTQVENDIASDLDDAEDRAIRHHRRKSGKARGGDRIDAGEADGNSWLRG